MDISASVAKLLDLYQPAMADRQYSTHIDLEEHVFVDADSSLMSRVISNLLENELTHLPPGCHIAFHLRSHDGSAQFSIEDDGPGFPAEIMHRAFERFIKGKHSPGHGLGLAFVHAVVQAHGGAVELSARPDGGASITVLLPLSVARIDLELEPLDSQSSP